MMIGSLLVSANCGDSRSIMLNKGTGINSWNTKILSKDHKPDVESEASRIISSGG